MAERLKKVIFKEWRREGTWAYMYGKDTEIFPVDLVDMWNEVPVGVRLQIIGDPNLRTPNAKFTKGRRGYVDLIKIGKHDIYVYNFPDMWNAVPAEYRKDIIEKYKGEFNHWL